MNLKTEELDRIFSGAGAFIQTGQNMCHILSDGFKDVQNAFDSRRNMGPQYQCNMPSYTDRNLYNALLLRSILPYQAYREGYAGILSD
jgi:hypothetical protein